MKLVLGRDHDRWRPSSKQPCGMLSAGYSNANRTIVERGSARRKHEEERRRLRPRMRNQGEEESVIHADRKLCAEAHRKSVARSVDNLDISCGGI